MTGQSQPLIESRQLNSKGAKQLFRSRICRAASLLTAFTAIMGLTLHASADDQVPFKGHADVVLTGAQPEPDGLHLTAAATGKATHLGQFTRDEHAVLHGDGTIDGSLTFTAANGDQSRKLVRPCQAG